MSKNPSIKSFPQGDSIYYPDVIFRKSKLIYWTGHISIGSNWGSDTTTYTDVTTTTIDTLTGGTDDYSTTIGEIELVYDKFKNVDTEDVNLIIGGSSSIVGDTYNCSRYSCHNDYTVSRR